VDKLNPLLAACFVLAWAWIGGGWCAEEQAKDRPWQDTFELDKCTHLTTGKNRFFILEPGYQIVLASKTVQVFITVLQETVKINGIETRVIEEREFGNGKLKEVSRNFYTICKEHGDVFYHGEDVDDYEDGKVVGHGGTWRAGVDGARAGLMMPGKTAVGLRHYQEIAPKVAMDRAEIVEDDVTLEAPGKKYTHCLKVLETTPLEATKSIKLYAPEVGLVFDDGMVIVDRGSDRTPPKGPIEVKADVGGAYAEVEVSKKDMPEAVAEVVGKLHPKGEIREIKRETRADGQTVYALEILVGGEQYDLEVTPEGKVLRNKKE